MATSPITTPTQAQQILDLTNSQFNTIRAYFGINDNPYQTDKTYIVFDADVGNNNLHIITDASHSYSISKGNGTLPVDYTDIGGTKVLNYTIAGRYLITIDGTFNGIDTTGASAGDKDKYIEIIGGSNYPTTIVATAFQDCENLIYVKFDNVTEILTSAFLSCGYLKEIDFKILSTPTGVSIFELCSRLKIIKIRQLVTVEFEVFKGCGDLEYIDFPVLTLVEDNGFENCNSLSTIIFPSLTRINNGAFRGCDSLMNIHILNVTLIEDFGFSTSLATEPDALKYINLPSITSLGASVFSNRESLNKVDIKYTSGLSIGSNAFNNVNLTDLYVRGAANGTEAAAVETKLTTAGMTQLNAYRLLY